MHKGEILGLSPDLVIRFPIINVSRTEEKRLSPYIAFEPEPVTMEFDRPFFFHQDIMKKYMAFLF